MSNIKVRLVYDNGVKDKYIDIWEIREFHPDSADSLWAYNYLFSGFMDKDQNEIYEGDKISCSTPKLVGEVEFKEGVFGVWLDEVQVVLLKEMKGIELLNRKKL